MPRKERGDKLERVISSKISSEDFQVLERDARMLYNKNTISQPTISHLVRHIVKKWVRYRLKKEGKLYNPFQHTPPEYDFSEFELNKE